MGRPPAPLGTRARDRGWVRVKTGPGHPLAIDGWAREHRLVLYDQIGPGAHRCYRCGVTVEWGSTLEVDHLNRDRGDNRVANLAAACRACQNANRQLGLRHEAMSATDLLAELRSDPGALAEFRQLLGAGPAVYTCATLAAELDCTPRAVRAAIERGELAAVRSGRGWVIASEAVARWATPATVRTKRGRRGSANRTMRDALGRLETNRTIVSTM